MKSKKLSINNSSRRLTFLLTIETGSRLCFDGFMNDVTLNREVIYKDSYRRKTKQIGIWVDSSDWELYNLLSKEYGVDTPEEMRRVMLNRLHELRDEVILSKDIA